MKIVPCLILLILLLAIESEKLFAQIPNPSFENWINSNPVGWATSNEGADGISESVIESDSAYSGNYAVELAIQPLHNSFSNPLPSTITVGDISGNETGFHISSAPGTLHGWYKSSFIDGDNIMVVGGTFGKYMGSEINTGILKDSITANTSIYKEFVFNYAYPIVNTADSSYLSFELSNSRTSIPHVGSYFILDDLSFDDAASVKDIKDNSTVSLEQNFPNPASDNTNIIYSLQSTSNVTLSIIDMLGRTVKTIVANEKQTPGRYKAIANISDLAAGNYFYQLSAGGSIVSKLMAVAK